MQSQQEKESIFNAWSAQHPHVVIDLHNVTLIEQFLSQMTGGIISIGGLDWALSELAGQLHYLAGADISQQLQVAASVQRQTRVATTDPTSRAKFRRYWACLSPGIILIRWISLGPLKAEAERRARQALLNKR